MDVSEQVTKWVQNKIEKVINNELKEKIVEENSAFDIEVYANNLLDKYFKDDEVRSLKEILSTGSYNDLSYTESENSSEQSLRDSLESESNECQNFSVEKIIKNLKLESREVTKKSLIVLEACAEDFINQTSWDKIKEILQKILNKTEDREIMILILKVLQKPLRFSKKLQIVSKGFSTVVELVIHEIHVFNLEQKNISCEKIHDVNENEWLWENNSQGFSHSKFRSSKSLKLAKSEVLIKLMWLLIDCQHQISVKWVRFNEARFREIIFSFVHLLNTTNTSENSKLSGLELLSVLNPKASWCRCWCHTAIGRSLLCSALRKYKHFFVHIIEIILNHIKIKKANKLPPVRDGAGLKKNCSEFGVNISLESKPFSKNYKVDSQKERKNYLEKTSLNDRSKCFTSAHDNTQSNFSRCIRIKKLKKSSSEWIVGNIPKLIVSEAVFFHSISFVSCLIQFRSGRALFPVQTATRKQLLSVKDLSGSLIEYLENINFEWAETAIKYTSTYESDILKMLETLKKVNAHINSSRMNTERQPFSYFRQKFQN